jgi:hypothetical protein
VARRAPHPALRSRGWRQSSQSAVTKPITDQTNQTDIPAISSDIFVYKNDP